MTELEKYNLKHKLESEIKIAIDANIYWVNDEDYLNYAKDKCHDEIMQHVNEYLKEIECANK